MSKHPAGLAIICTITCWLLAPPLLSSLLVNILRNKGNNINTLELLVDWVQWRPISTSSLSTITIINSNNNSINCNFWWSLYVLGLLSILYVSLMFGRCAFVILCCVHTWKWECFDDNFGWDWLAYCYKKKIEMYYWLMSLKFMIEKKSAADCRLSCVELQDQWGHHGGPAVTSKQPQPTGQRPLGQSGVDPPRLIWLIEYKLG